MSRWSTPLDVLREALALHYSMGHSRESATKQSMAALEDALAALADVEALIDAARHLHENRTRPINREWNALATALARFDNKDSQA